MNRPAAIWAVVIDPDRPGLLASQEPSLCNLIDHEEGAYYFSDQEDYTITLMADNWTWNQFLKMHSDVLIYKDGEDGGVVLVSLSHEALCQAIKGALGMLTAVQIRLLVIS